uniref:receptor protein-tyrosine kinase n=1 Tax=Ditylenchus dipsaci TaxID=166011 RepID=A0A915D6W2_9BILA
MGAKKKGANIGIDHNEQGNYGLFCVNKFLRLVYKIRQMGPTRNGGKKRKEPTLVLTTMSKETMDYFGMESANTTQPTTNFRKYGPYQSLKQGDTVCLGTDNSRNTINVENNMNHYQRLKKSFISFFEDLEEVTGYILIFNVRVEQITLPKLKIIWGEKQHEGNALQIDSSSGLHYLNMPSLRSIEQGNITIKRSPDLCYMDPNHHFVDYSEFLVNRPEQKVLIIDKFSRNCESLTKPCDRACEKSSCFGPGPDQCQTIYRRICPSCESNACYVDGQNTSRCCDDACAGGCYGDGKEKCVACKHFEQDDKCVIECTGIDIYNPNTKMKESLPDDRKRYYYGRHCVNECPSGTLIEDKYCVTRCSEKFHRDVHKDDRRCVPCSGECPKVCQMTEPINSLNIRNFVNCSEIEGNIEILNHVFEENLPDVYLSSKVDRNKVIPALTATDLEVLKSVRIVTGYIAIDGGRHSNSNKPHSLSFLENLEMIEGRQLYFEKYSLYVIGNADLKWLGLKSLKKIKHGLLSFSHNKNLCYSYTIPFGPFLGVKESVWKNNKNPDECERVSRKCDANCDASLGCWDLKCAATCPTEGYYVDEDKYQCHQCHEQCLECDGPDPTQCSKCKKFEQWTHKEADETPDGYIIVRDENKRCVSKCPNETYADGVRCELCDLACYGLGCTGPKPHLGKGGCNRCRYAIEEEDNDNKLRCLVGETENTVCGPSNNISGNYYVGVGPRNISKYMCHKCRPECASCFRDGISTRDCACSNYKLSDGVSEVNDICVMDCGKGSYTISNKTDSPTEYARNTSYGECRKCHELCDDRYSCSGTQAFECEKCAFAGLLYNDTTFECLKECPEESPFTYEGMCHEEDKDVVVRRKRNTIISAAFAAFLLFIIVITYLVYRCVKYRKKYEKEAQMHMPDIPLLIQEKLDFYWAFGIVYAGKWKPPSRSGISLPVAIKAINPSESRHTTDAEMMKEAGLMASIQHEHLLPLVGICVGKGGIKIITILRPLGSLLKFLDQHKQRLGSKNLMLYCYQISAAMEFLAKKKIVHRDLATRNVLVKNINHVEVTDFGLAQMLQGSETSVVIEGRVAVKWLAIESLRQQIYTERTDVWSFGVTCWEILTFGQTPPYKELGLPRDHKLARELAYQLEKGYRLKQPANCSQELYQEMLNCWLVDPGSRPTFRQIKERLEQFCRAPHIYVQERQATQRMDSITNSEQRMMIERLLQDSDFLDPVNIDPAEYALHSPTIGNKDGGGSLFSANTLETLVPASPTTPNIPLMLGNQNRHGSTDTNSTRYKSDPVQRRHHLSSTTTDDSRISELEMDEENYLMPKGVGHSIIGKSIDEEEEEDQASLYTPVIAESKPGFNKDDVNCVPTYLNETDRPNEYANHSKQGDVSNGVHPQILKHYSPTQTKQSMRMAPAMLPLLI